MYYIKKAAITVLEDNVSHTHGIYPQCTPSLCVLSLFPFSFW